MLPYTGKHCQFKDCNYISVTLVNNPEVIKLQYCSVVVLTLEVTKRKICNSEKFDLERNFDESPRSRTPSDRKKAVFGILSMSRSIREYDSSKREDGKQMKFGILLTFDCFVRSLRQNLSFLG
ncbi:hypothetical protein AVEN_205257-1 [Araneus ventricosus]|uniref:Uncharacterized protein n=1 Tax=Araneus ventricosus TaxID=182803 RepID=A0A4Y2EEC5_ARAVE|nr:hypothetical protein AVEN_205257-1 [Araneus ventricosus]